MRTALGARRGRIVRQLLSEGVVLSGYLRSGWARTGCMGRAGAARAHADAAPTCRRDRSRLSRAGVRGSDRRSHRDCVRPRHGDTCCSTEPGIRVGRAHAGVGGQTAEQGRSRHERNRVRGHSAGGSGLASLELREASKRRPGIRRRKRDGGALRPDARELLEDRCDLGARASADRPAVSPARCSVRRRASELPARARLEHAGCSGGRRRERRWRC